MKFFKEIKDSIYNPSFYQEVLTTKSFSESVKYFFKYIAIFILAMTLITSFRMIPGVSSSIREVSSYVVNEYPSDLTITLEKGKASTNMSEPIMFPSPKEFKDDQKVQDNFLVIDTKNPFTMDHFNSYKTFALITSDSIIMQSSTEIKIFPLSKLGDRVITQSTLESWIATVSSFKILIIFVICVFFLIGNLFLYSGYLLYMFIFALLGMLLLSIMKIKVAYKKSYQIGLYIITLPLLIDFMSGILNTFIHSSNFDFHVRFLFTAIGLVLVYLNFKKNSKENVELPESAKTE